MRLDDAGAAFAQVYAALHGRCFAEGWSAAAIAELLSGPGVFGAIAAAEAAPLGFVLCRAVADEAEILAIGTLPEARGRGVAGALLRRAEAEAASRGAERMFLEVAVTNDAALALYGRAGFQPVGTRRGYYRVQVGGRTIETDARILAKNLDPATGTAEPGK